MPICKNCHSRIDKFNKDRCPICGTENPFEGVNSDTIEITTSLDVDDFDYNPRKKSKVLFYSVLLGFVGMQFFYLYQKKQGIISCVVNLLLIILLGFLIGYFTSLAMYLSFIIFFIGDIFVNSIIGFILYKKPNLKDGHGEFVI